MNTTGSMVRFIAVSSQLSWQSRFEDMVGKETIQHRSIVAVLFSSCMCIDIELEEHMSAMSSSLLPCPPSRPALEISLPSIGIDTHHHGIMGTPAQHYNIVTNLTHGISTHTLDSHQAHSHLQHIISKHKVFEASPEGLHATADSLTSM